MVVINKKFDKTQLTTIYQVDENQQGLRLDQVAQTYLTSFSRQKIKEKIRNGEIIIEGRGHAHRPSTKVIHNDIITIIIKKTSHEDEYWNNQLLDIKTVPEIIFEDDFIVVISKPPYMSTHPTGRHIFNCATVYFEAIYNKTVHSVHRLDRETSGVMLLAKNPATANELTRHFEEDRVRKCYFFISKILDNTSILQRKFKMTERMGPMGAGLERVMNQCYPFESTRGKHAETNFTILHQENNYVLGIAFPKTGRQHQIRLHACAKGLPLIGDKLYLGGYKMFQRFKDQLASNEDHALMELPRHALHAMAINLPYNNDNCIFKGKLPQDLRDWIKLKTTKNIHVLEEEINLEITSYFNQVHK